MSENYNLFNYKSQNYTDTSKKAYQNKEYKLKAGEVIIFPSNFLYPHKVNPVSKGTRYTFISWVH